MPRTFARAALRTLLAKHAQAMTPPAAQTPAPAPRPAVAAGPAAEMQRGPRLEPGRQAMQRAAITPASAARLAAGTAANGPPRHSLNALRAEFDQRNRQQNLDEGNQLIDQSRRKWGVR